uniref:Uncharacterized protein n=1 Tax=Salix viminalis TaxID=40686 RepID=A0A6N2LC31_SALVM
MESIGISKRVQTAFRMSEKCRQTFGKRKGCDFRSWNWESIFHHGYCRSPMMGRKYDEVPVSEIYFALWCF